jgi:peptidoglycan/LPS O-acetylase OafA/YrhL
LFLLFDYPVFQLLDIAHVDVWWRIRPYNTAEPFWTVAIEFWIYIAMSLLFFCAIKREKIRAGWIVLLALVSVPVILWNAADGAGKALTLTWLVGGMAGFLVVFMGADSAAARSKLLAWIIVACGAASLGARIVKLGFDPYDLQTNFLMTVIFFGVFLRLNQATTAWKIPTVLVIVFENTHSWPKPYAIAFGVVLAHCVALLVYHSFEKHHRAVGTYLRPIFSRALLKSSSQVPQTQTVSPAVQVAAAGAIAVAPVAVEAKSELPAVDGPGLESHA